MYDPQGKRFLAIDPIKFGLNWYGYVEGNPVLYIDIFGLAPVRVRNGAIIVSDFREEGRGITTINNVFVDDKGVVYVDLFEALSAFGVPLRSRGWTLPNTSNRILFNFTSTQTQGGSQRLIAEVLDSETQHPQIYSTPYFIDSQRGLHLISFDYFTQLMCLAWGNAGWRRLEANQPVWDYIKSLPQRSPCGRFFYPIDLSKATGHGDGHPYRAIDLSAPAGTTVFAFTGGRVISDGRTISGETSVTIFGDDNYIYYYAHLTPGSVPTGGRAEAGSQIGTVNSGHLHFDITKSRALGGLYNTRGAMSRSNFRDNLNYLPSFVSPQEKFIGIWGVVFPK
jgi:murein DD-endopeptidase MepM/ murein hydrolase activator NlpD